MAVQQSTGKTIVVGLGLTGLSCARYLHKQGIEFSVVDSRSEPPGLGELRELDDGITVSLGEFDAADFAGAETLVMSPGVDARHPVISTVKDEGACLRGDVDIFVHSVEAPIVAVTGSNAKSTVVTLLGEMAKQTGVDGVVAGNIGRPVLDLLEEGEHALYILELSSFQLETTHDLNAEVASILNLSMDHMDRYPDMETYLHAKQRIFQGSRKVVFNRNDPLTEPPADYQGKRWSFGLNKPAAGQFGILEQDGQRWLAQGDEKLLPVSALKIPGKHNQANALAALALGLAAGLPMPAMLKTLQEFPGLPHRCQWLGEYKGVEWYNDSKGTNVGASVAAIEGLAEKGPIVLLAGGQGKGGDFSQLRPALSVHVKALILFGEDAARIETAVADSTDIHHVDSMKQAVALAATLSEKGDQVLLSPACASFDMFDNYQQRGDVFAAEVRRLFSC